MKIWVRRSVKNYLAICTLKQRSNDIADVDNDSQNHRWSLGKRNI